MSGEGDPYLLATLLSFDTRERLDRYLRAMQSVINRNDILRTAVMWEGLFQPVQVVQHSAVLQIQEIELDPADGDVGGQLYARFDPRRYRIDLRQAPLLRSYIAFDKSQNRWLMMQLLHHLLADHTTMDVMHEEIQAHLLGVAERLPAPLPFRNLVAQARLGVSKEEHEGFFRKMLADVDEPTAPFGLFDVQGDGTGIEEARVALETPLAERVRERARKLGISAASLCHLAWARVLAKVSGREDVVFGTVLFGRMQGGAGSDRVMGLFTNTLPVRIRIAEEGVESCVRQTQALLAGLMRHEHALLALAQRCSAVPAPAPLFSAILNYRHSPGVGRAARAWEGICTIRVEERTNYPLTLSVDDVDGEGFWLTAQTLASVNSKRICEYMQTALESLVTALETTPSMAVRELETLPASEKRQLLYEWNDTEYVFPQTCIHELFERQVERSPDAVAIIFEDSRLTYRELNRRANQLAWYLHKRGVGPDVPVGLCIDRGPEMVIALLGILKAGGAYVPLDPRLPEERLRFMVEDVRPRVVLTKQNLWRAPFGKDAIILDGSWATIAQENTANIENVCGPRDLAYVMYTSGSTGKPKGVSVDHRGVVNLLASMQREVEVTSDDVLLAVTTLSFDIAGLEVYLPLISGARLVIASGDDVVDGPRLRDLLTESKATVMQATPATWRLLIEAGWQGSPNLKILCGGEAFPPELAKDLIARSNSVWNVYGPTETTIWSSIYRVTGHEQGSIPIGRPVANTSIYVLDSHRNPVPVNVIGEIYIGGHGLARGYLNRAELTAERFVANRLTPERSPRLYRTGDLGRFRSNGEIEYLGRIDNQVKLRGLRIELGEIESVLAAREDVVDAVVILSGEGEQQKLAAHLVMKDETALAAGELRRYLQTKLPEHMVPASYWRVDALPLLPSGKVNRAALAGSGKPLLDREELTAPRNEVETKLAEIWQELLQVEQVGIEQNFFELGGHSLLVLQVTARIRRIFEVELAVRSVFEAPTIAGLALEVQKAQALGLKARSPILQGLRQTAAGDASQDELLIQLEKLSAKEARNLLKDLLDGKQDYQFRS
jgi:amino acid adenylation domain-containing protein